MQVIILFPVLVVYLLLLFILYFTNRMEAFRFLRNLGAFVFFVVPPTLFALGLVFNGQPLKLEKSDLTGEYLIDTTFYPGPDARWQHEHLRIYISEADTLSLLVKQKNGFNRVHKAYLKYNSSENYIFSVHPVDSPAHPILRTQPVRYRSHKRFYYVFRSPLYKNLFFRNTKKPVHAGWFD